MPVLPNNKHELFAQGLAKGLSADAAYQAAGYKPHRGNAARLRTNESIQTRLAEIQGKAAEKAEVSKAWVMERLKETVERAMQAVPVLDCEGKPTGEYTYQGAVANRALELIGKELGMFARKQPSDEDNPLTLRVTIDAPPDETREQWLARTARERGLPAPAIVGPQSGPLTEAIASRWCQEPWRPGAEEREQRQATTRMLKGPAEFLDYFPATTGV